MIGQNQGGAGEALVTYADSHWLINGPLEIGMSGVGLLTIADGGYVSTAGYARIAAQLFPEFPFEESAEGEVIATGSESRWDIAGELYVIDNGLRGRLTITDGGIVSCANLHHGLAIYTADGIDVLGIDSKLSVSGEVEGALRLRVGDGALASARAIQGSAIEITDGGRVTADTIFIGQLDGDSQVEGNVTVTSRLRPGNPVGTLTIKGDLALERDPTTEIRILGSEPGLFSAVKVTGPATVSGELLVIDDRGVGAHARRSDSRSQRCLGSGYVCRDQCLY